MLSLKEDSLNDRDEQMFVAYIDGGWNKVKLPAAVQATVLSASGGFSRIHVQYKSILQHNKLWECRSANNGVPRHPGRSFPIPKKSDKSKSSIIDRSSFSFFSFFFQQCRTTIITIPFLISLFLFSLFIPHLFIPIIIIRSIVLPAHDLQKRRRCELSRHQQGFALGQHRPICVANGATTSASTKRCSQGWRRWCATAPTQTPARTRTGGSTSACAAHGHGSTRRRSPGRTAAASTTPSRPPRSRCVAARDVA